MEFVIKNTIQLQVQSVIGFMSALGYVPDNRVKDLSFFNLATQGSACQVISFSTASRLHNSDMEDWKICEGNDSLCMNAKVGLPIAWSVQTVLLALAGKLVKQNKVAFRRNGEPVINSDLALMVQTDNKFVAGMIDEPLKSE